VLTAGAVFILSNPANTVARKPPVVIGEVAAHPHAITLTYDPAVLGWLRVATADRCIHIHIHKTLLKAKYCPRAAAASRTQKNTKKHVTLTFDL